VFTQTNWTTPDPNRESTLILAARFAAKEAVAKAFGRPFSWQEVEIYTEPSGKPGVTLYGEALKAAGNAARVLVSVSHSEHYASAVAILVRD